MQHAKLRSLLVLELEAAGEDLLASKVRRSKAKNLWRIRSLSPAERDRVRRIIIELEKKHDDS